jgi:hypothetical protein
MIGLALTLDYEIYGNGTGSIGELVIQPTSKFLSICEEYNAYGTLFVEVVEFLKMKQHDRFKRSVNKVEEQIMMAHENGHDVQLHIHPWWYNAIFKKNKWLLDFSMSTLCNLDTPEIANYIKIGKQYLFDILNNSKREYFCKAFRAGAWSMMPSMNIHDALIAEKIAVDSSVFKWGKNTTPNMAYDYSQAYSNIQPWFFDRDDINALSKIPAENALCLEIPIYSELKRGLTFLTPKRIKLIKRVRSATNEYAGNQVKPSVKTRYFQQINDLLGKRAKKFDFCKCTFSEMKDMLHNIITHNPPNGYLPVAAIGHSKDFIFMDDFKKMIEYITKNFSGIMEIVPLTKAAQKMNI